MLDKKSLLTRCQQHDSKAQRQLYERYRGRLMGIALRYAHQRSDAEDIFQEAFIQAFRSLHQVTQPEALLGWLKKIVIRTAIRHYHHAHQSHWVSWEEIPVVASEDDYTILSKLQQDQLLQLINQLPDGYRLVFNLYVIDGYSHEEIAKIAGIKEASSRSQLARAKQQLKCMLRQLGIQHYEKYG